MKSSEVVEMLQKDLADELAAIIQYMYHHIMVAGAESANIGPLFRATALDEMRHAERLAERVSQLGGVPTPQPTAIKTGGTATTMIKQDLSGELAAIRNYAAQIHEIADEDLVTRRLLEDLLLDENRHAEQWKTILGK